ncbi:MAG TPA: CU044_2847 family protein [Pyrinomonadaceae bacterium]|nr:CU044_2847 family protein [Pyrinomonadaceae bacterium]
MAHLIEIPLDGGGSVLLEVGENGGGTKRGLGRTEITEKATQTFEEAITKIRPVADAIIDQLRQLVVAPEEIGVEFGIKLNADAKAYIASAGAEANFRVTLKWKRENLAT